MPSVIPGLTRNPESVQTEIQLNAGSVILESIQDQHGGKENAID
jgi:hypothetical protein